MTPLAVLGFSVGGADLEGHKMEVNMQSHPHQIVSMNLVASIKRVLDVQFRNFEEDKRFKEVVENFKEEKMWSFEESMDPVVQRAPAL